MRIFNISEIGETKGIKELLKRVYCLKGFSCVLHAEMKDFSRWLENTYLRSGYTILSPLVSITKEDTNYCGFAHALKYATGMRKFYRVGSNNQSTYDSEGCFVQSHDAEYVIVGYLQAFLLGREQLLDLQPIGVRRLNAENKMYVKARYHSENEVAFQGGVPGMSLVDIFSVIVPHLHVAFDAELHRDCCGFKDANDYLCTRLKGLSSAYTNKYILQRIYQHQRQRARKYLRTY